MMGLFISQIRACFPSCGMWWYSEVEYIVLFYMAEFYMERKKRKE